MCAEDSEQHLINLLHTILADRQIVIVYKEEAFDWIKMDLKNQCFPEIYFRTLGLQAST